MPTYGTTKVPPTVDENAPSFSGPGRKSDERGGCTTESSTDVTSTLRRAITLNTVMLACTVGVLLGLIVMWAICEFSAHSEYL